MSAHVKDQQRTARKQHLCYLCELPILPGDTYLCRVATDEGRIYNVSMHPECAQHARRWTEFDWEEHVPCLFREEHGIKAAGHE